MSATDYGLIGHPLQHSLSPSIHSSLMGAAGLKGTYSLFDLPPDDLPGAVPGLLANLAGFNCTIPHKETIKAYLDGLDPLAAITGTVNTVYQRRGFNTDLPAFIEDCPSMAGHRILILGAGGVSRTMAFAAAAAGAGIWILARRPEQAQTLASDLRRAYPGSQVSCPATLADNLADAASQDGDCRPWGLLNGTPLGMWPQTAGLPFPEECLERFHFVYDTIYNPVATRLILAARSRGIKARSGLGMLFGQALAAQRIWHPAAVFSSEDISMIRRQMAWNVLAHSPLTLVLTGFMGSGKTAVGQALAARLKLPFLDLDRLIEQAAGQSIPDLFASQGEAYFRRIEQQQLGLVLKSGRSQVMATGGGALVDPAAESLVRRSPSLIFYLETPLQVIRQRVGEGQGRPMIFRQGEKRLTSLFCDRQPRYRALADYRVDGRSRPEEIAARIAANLGLEDNNP
jgi:shikimate dehydrogenase